MFRLRLDVTPSKLARGRAGADRPGRMEGSSVRKTLTVYLTEKDVKKAIGEYALRGVDLGEEWKPERDIVLLSCNLKGAKVLLKPNYDLRLENGGPGA